MLKSAFLNGKLDEECCVKQPQGFFVQGGEEKVYTLKKALYGLKQTPRAWYNEIDTYFLENNFQTSKSEATLYVKKEHDSVIIGCLYVDDLLFTGNDVKMMQNFMQDVMQIYEMSDIGLLNYFLGIEVSQVKEGIFISQKNYTKNILQNYYPDSCKNQAKCILKLQSVCYCTCKKQQIM